MAVLTALQYFGKKIGTSEDNSPIVATIERFLCIDKLEDGNKSIHGDFSHSISQSSPPIDVAKSSTS